jgi:hypothetical protein
MPFRLQVPLDHVYFGVANLGLPRYPIKQVTNLIHYHPPIDLHFRMFNEA